MAAEAQDWWVEGLVSNVEETTESNAEGELSWLSCGYGQAYKQGML